MLLRPVDVPAVGEQQQIPAADVLDPLGVGGEVEGLGIQLLVLDPADILIGQVLHADIHIVLIFQPVFQHVELERAHHPHDDLLHAAANLLEDLDGALLGDLGGALDKLLALHGVHLPHQAEMLRGEGGDPLEGKSLAGRGAGRVSFSARPGHAARRRFCRTGRSKCA